MWPMGLLFFIARNSFSQLGDEPLWPIGPLFLKVWENSAINSCQFINFLIQLINNSYGTNKSICLISFIFSNCLLMIIFLWESMVCNFNEKTKMAGLYYELQLTNLHVTLNPVLPNCFLVHQPYHRFSCFILAPFGKACPKIPFINLIHDGKCPFMILTIVDVQELLIFIAHILTSVHYELERSEII